MQTAVPLACFLSIIRPPGVQYENALLQIAPVDKSKCPYVKDNNDVGFQLFTRHNPTVFQELVLGDDEKLFASNIDFNDKTMIYFHAWMEQPDDGSGIMVREAYMQRGDTNVIMVDAHHLEAGPWYFTAAQNTWYIGRFAAQFIDYLASRGLNLNKTHLVGHSLGAHAAGVAGAALKTGRVARITGLDPALPLFDHLPLEQRLDETDAKFVDIIHTDAGIFGYKAPMGHADFYPNGGISPQPGCELEVVIPKQLLLNKSTGDPICSMLNQCYVPPRLLPVNVLRGRSTDTENVLPLILRGWDMVRVLSDNRTVTRGFYSYYLTANRDSKHKTLESKLANLFAFIHAAKAKADIKNSNTSKNATYEYNNKTVHPHSTVNDTYTSKTVNQVQNKALSNHNTHSIKDTTVINDHNEPRNLIKNETITQDNGKLLETANNSSKSVNIEAEESTEEFIDDQIAESSEYDLTQIKLNQDTLKDKETLSIINESEEFLLENGKEVKTRDVLPRDLYTDKENKDHINDEEGDTGKDETRFTLFDVEDTNLSEGTLTNDKTTITSNIDTLYYKEPCEPKNTLQHTTENSFKVTKIPIENIKMSKRKPNPINILNVLESTYRISRVISSLKNNKGKTLTNKLKKLLIFKDNIGTTQKSFMRNLPFLPSNISPQIKNHVVKRQKRFLPFLRRNEEVESGNIIFKMLDFLIKNRKNVLPVFTVMREINTLVKSGNGELNHFTREQNNYIGATPPAFTPVSYTLELGNENRAVAFIKRLLGMSPKGDRLSISGRK